MAIGIVVSTVVIAPLVEELLFRGLLLRALLRRVRPVTAVMVSALLFGVVHLLDFRALLAVPALTVVGATLSVVALRTNSLSRPIFIHAGFNLTATVAALATSSVQRPCKTGHEMDRGSCRPTNTTLGQWVQRLTGLRLRQRVVA